MQVLWLKHYRLATHKSDILGDHHKIDLELTEKVPIRKSQRTGILDQIENLFTAGYGKKEDLRELDKVLRDDYTRVLQELRHDLEKTYLAAIEANQKVPSSILKEVTQTLDRVTSKIQRADYGYAALLDRTSKIREEVLARVLEYDRELKSSIDDLGADFQVCQSAAEEEVWPKLSEAAAAAKKTLRDLEAKWTDREIALNQTGG